MDLHTELFAYCNKLQSFLFSQLCNYKLTNYKLCVVDIFKLFLQANHEDGDAKMHRECHISKGEVNLF